MEEERWIERRAGSGTFVLQRPKAVGDILLICSESCPPFEQIGIRSLSGLLKELEYNANVVVSDNPGADWDAILRKKPDAAGCVLLSPFSRGTVEKLVKRCKIPLVMIGDMDETHHGPALCDQVIPDNRAMGYRAADYLIRQGHRRIILMGTRTDEKVWSRNMRRGFEEAFLTHGIAPDPAWVIDVWDEKGILPQVQPVIDRLLQGDTPPTALIHAGDSEARVQDILWMNFHHHFADDAVIPVIPFEMLQAGFMGIRDAAAVTIRFEDLARRALELLTRQNPKDPPGREILAKIYLARRQNGQWSL